MSWVVPRNVPSARPATAIASNAFVLINHTPAGGNCRAAYDLRTGPLAQSFWVMDTSAGRAVLIARGGVMPKRVLVLACVVTGVVAAAGRREVVAQGSAAAALLGIVSSQEEGNMEGVLVSARQDGANFTVTVVSNAL